MKQGTRERPLVCLKDAATQFGITPEQLSGCIKNQPEEPLAKIFFKVGKRLVTTQPKIESLLNDPSPIG